MKDIIFDEFRAADCGEVLDLWRSIDGIYLHENGEDSVEGIGRYIARNRGLSFIAKKDNKIIGAVLCGHDGRRGIIHHLGVEEDFRMLGIAKKLLELSGAKLQEIGIKKSFLFVLKENPDAQSFYEQNGWIRENIVFVYSKMS
ncbi:MAG: GNAT family N-acetyltransferase [bacterium]|nr:GNAT family N-acetyltransferase [bacterium]